MDNDSKEKIVNRICAGYLSFNYDGAGFFIATPTLAVKCQADELYSDVDDATMDGLMDEDTYHLFLLENEFWTDQDESKLQDMIKELETLKVGIYESIFKSIQREKLRKALAIVLKELDHLHNKKHGQDHLSAKGHLRNCRFKYMIAMSIFNRCWQPFFSTGEDFMDSYSKIIDKAFMVLSENRIVESTFREIARTEPWRTMWTCSKIGDLFKKPVIEWSDEQKNLCLWSKIYDNVYEADSLPEDVIKDDDALDGWMIVQRRKKEATSHQGEVDRRLGVNKNAQEIYIVAETPEDARKIDNLNDPTAKAVKRQREKIIKERGQVKEIELPDQQMKMRLAANQKLMERAKNG